MAGQSKSIWTRKLDLLYLIFFVIHIPVMLVVDLSCYYPEHIRPQFTIDVRNYYIATYRDRFFLDPPAWFYAFVALEAFYHVPLSIWAVRGLLQDDLMVPLHLLIWAIETSLSTLVCCVEAASWDGYTRDEMVALGQLYVPYLILAVIMGVDMFIRLKNQLVTKSKIT